MKAKYVINEVKRGSGSAISRMGLGGIRFSAYNVIKERWPQILNSASVKPLIKNTDDVLDCMVPILTRTLDCDADDLLVIFPAFVYARGSEMSDWLVSVVKDSSSRVDSMGACDENGLEFDWEMSLIPDMMIVKIHARSDSAVRTLRRWYYVMRYK